MCCEVLIVNPTQSVILGHINKTDLTTLVAWQPCNDDDALERDCVAADLN